MPFSYNNVYSNTHTFLLKLLLTDLWGTKIWSVSTTHCHYGKFFSTPTRNLILLSVTSNCYFYEFIASIKKEKQLIGLMIILHYFRETLQLILDILEKYYDDR